MFICSEVLCTATVHTIKANGGRGVALHILNISMKWRLLVSFIPQPLFSLGKSQLYPLNWRLGGLQSWHGCFGEEKVSCICQELNARLSNP